MAVSTIHTTLKFGTSKEAITKMCPITTYPDLFGNPEKLDTTDLDNTQETSIAGVKKKDDMEFEFNYDKTVYETLSANEDTDGYFELEFGEDGKDGVFEWQGSYVLAVNGGGVNEVRKSKIVVSPSTDVVMKSE